MKKTLLFFLFLFALFLGIAVTLFGIFLYTNYYKSSTEETAEESEETPPARNYQLNKEVSAYIPWWDQDAAFESLQTNKDYIQTVHPFWYEVKADGSIDKFSGAEDQEIIDFCKDNNIQIIPAISNEQDPLPVEAIFDSPVIVEQHVQNITNLVLENGFDGVDIDYESLETADREDFSSFIVQLAVSLKEQNKLLTVAVHAKTSDEGTWDGPAAQDWMVFNEFTDGVNIMAYDYHWSTSEAGDIAPVDWVEDVLDYAVTVIEPEKIHLGVHFYGYDWLAEEAEDLTYTDVQEIIAAENITTIDVSTGLENYFTYKDTLNKTHTVYFADSYTIAPKIDLVNQFDIGGISIWRLGNEDPENWDVISDKFI
ncbi:peptidoglycan-binding protein [Candidatus Dojkabacteria bacterium]|nr:peptidoglycan-binding protein [Candidatus Dojkabacteria bacterium]